MTPWKTKLLLIRAILCMFTTVGDKTCSKKLHSTVITWQTQVISGFQQTCLLMLFF